MSRAARAGMANQTGAFELTLQVIVAATILVGTVMTMAIFLMHC